MDNKIEFQDLTEYPANAGTPVDATPEGETVDVFADIKEEALRNTSIDVLNRDLE